MKDGNVIVTVVLAAIVTVVLVAALDTCLAATRSQARALLAAATVFAAAQLVWLWIRMADKLTATGQVVVAGLLLLVAGTVWSVVRYKVRVIRRQQECQDEIRIHGDGQQSHR